MPRMLAVGTVLALPVLSLGVAACGSSGGSSDTSSTGPSSHGTSSTAAKPANNDGAATATFDGDLSGTIEANLCTGAVMSINVTVAGDSTTYHGSLSADSAGFVGPDATDFTVPTGGAKPTVSGTTYSVDGVELKDVVVSQKRVTLHGSLTCP